MSENDAVTLIRSALLVAAQISLPLFAVSLIIGLAVSLFQAVSQMSDVTLVIVPKLFCIGFVFTLTFPWILSTLSEYTTNLIINYWNILSEFPTLGSSFLPLVLSWNRR